MLTNKDVHDLGLNNPDISFKDYSCEDCENHDTCPTKYKAWFSYQATQYHKDNNIVIKAAAWCMGSNGLKKFSIKNNRKA